MSPDKRLLYACIALLVGFLAAVAWGLVEIRDAFHEALGL